MKGKGKKNGRERERSWEIKPALKIVYKFKLQETVEIIGIQEMQRLEGWE